MNELYLVNRNPEGYYPLRGDSHDKSLIIIVGGQFRDEVYVKFPTATVFQRMVPGSRSYSGDKISIDMTLPLEKRLEKEDNFMLRYFPDFKGGTGIFARNSYWMDPLERVYDIEEWKDFPKTGFPEDLYMVYKILQLRSGHYIITLGKKYHETGEWEYPLSYKATLDGSRVEKMRTLEYDIFRDGGSVEAVLEDLVGDKHEIKIPSPLGLTKERLSEATYDGEKCLYIDRRLELEAYKDIEKELPKWLGLKIYTDEGDIRRG